MLNNSRTRIVVVEDEEQLDKVLSVRDACPALHTIVVLENKEGLRAFDDPMVLTWDAFLGQGQAATNPDLVERAVAETAPDDLAILIYTSGTTGRPKAAMISHGNLIFQISTAPLLTPLAPGDQTLSFLPLCHVAERNYAAYMSIAFGNTVNFAESPETMLENLREVSPTALFAPPRTWEKMYSLVTLAVKDATRFQRCAFDRALALGRAVADVEDRGERPRLPLRLLHRLAMATVLRNVRTALGIDRTRYALTGAAPVAPDLIRWFRSLGLRLREPMDWPNWSALSPPCPSTSTARAGPARRRRASRSGSASRARSRCAGRTCSWAT